jgi:hypothetical protein
MFAPRHDPLLWIYLHPHVCVILQKNSFTIFASIFLSNHFSPCRQHYQGLPKPWVPHLGFGVKYKGFYEGAGTSR